MRWISRLGLRGRLALTHVAVAALAIVVVVLVVQFVGGRRFDRYLSASVSTRQEALAGAIADAWRASQTWTMSAMESVNEIASAQGLGVAVYDASGSLVFVAGQIGGGRRGGGLMDGHGMMDGQRTLNDGASQLAGGGTRRAMAISVNGRDVGTAVIFAPAQSSLPLSSAYRHDMLVYVLLAGIGAAAAAILISVAVSRRITRPLSQLAEAADGIAEGKREVDVPVSGSDEVSRLSAAFNGMADSLRRQAEWRRTATADLAHELRTPLATIQARVEAIEDGVMPATPENVRVIGEEVERLGRLLGTLRTLDDLDMGELQLQLQTADLGSLAQDVATAMEAGFSSSGVTLISECGPVPVRCDPDRIRQVCVNVLDNARKFTPAGGWVRLVAGREPAVILASTREGAPVRASADGAGDAAVLMVLDSGPGFAVEDLPYVFERFYRGAGSHRRDGTGLGLAIVKRLVTNHGGAVSATNAPGGGAAVRIELPLAAGKDVPAET